MNLHRTDIREAGAQPQPRFEVVKLRGGAVGVNLHASVVEIPGPAGDAGFVSRALREIAIAYALHAAGDEETATDYFCWDSGHVFLNITCLP
jgi:hypothetical protein